MVFAEFVIAAFGLPVDFMASFYHGWKMGQTLCHVTGFILTTTGKYVQKINLILGFGKTCVKETSLKNRANRGTLIFDFFFFIALFYLSYYFQVKSLLSL